MKSAPLSGPNAALGPLAVSKANPRYFAIGSNDGQVVYLTGSHLNNNFHDGMGPGADCAETPESNDFSAYLDFLKSHGHNFVRLWRWEHFKSLSPDGSFHLCMSPQPWPRTGPGVATDGKPSLTSKGLIRRTMTGLETASSLPAMKASTSR